MGAVIRSMGIQQDRNVPVKCAGSRCNHVVTSSKQLVKRPVSSIVRMKSQDTTKCRFNTKCSVVVSKQRRISKKNPSEHAHDKGLVGYCSKYYGKCSCSDCVVPEEKKRPATASELRQLFVQHENPT